MTIRVGRYRIRTRLFSAPAWRLGHLSERDEMAAAGRAWAARFRS